MLSLACKYQGAKTVFEMLGKRNQRFVLHRDYTAAPAKAKVIYLLVHGEAAHSAWLNAELAAGRDGTATRENASKVPPELHDPLLTPKGEASAAAAAERARELPPAELVVVSPMRRATQTGLAAFAGAIDAGAPVVSHELCREAWDGSDPPLWQSRLARDALKEAYPQVDGIAVPVTPLLSCDSGHKATLMHCDATRRWISTVSSSRRRSRP